MDLASFRKSRGLSQLQVAEQLGFASKSYVSGIENGSVSCPVRLALQIEEWSSGEVRALDLAAGDDLRLLKQFAGRLLAA